MSTALLELTLTLKKTDYIIITVILRCPRIIVLGHLKNEITAATSQKTTRPLREL